MALAVLIALGGCKRLDMYQQPRSAVWDRSNFFADGKIMRPPVPGTVPRELPDAAVPEPKVVTEAMLARGHERFDIYCAPCHGRAGDGTGMIVQRGFPHPPSLHAERLIKAKASLFYDTITHGHGAMYSYADRVSSPDRWAIVAYIRALQLSQAAPASMLSDADTARLQGAP